MTRLPESPNMPSPAAPGWQPIATAPKDGTPIIAYQPGGKYCNGHEYPACVGLSHWYGDGWEGPYNPRDFPTHWMPLPAPPDASVPSPPAAVEANDKADYWLCHTLAEYARKHGHCESDDDMECSEHELCVTEYCAHCAAVWWLEEQGSEQARAALAVSNPTQDER